MELHLNHNGIQIDIIDAYIIVVALPSYPGYATLPQPEETVGENGEVGKVIVE